MSIRQTLNNIHIALLKPTLNLKRKYLFDESTNQMSVIPMAITHSKQMQRPLLHHIGSQDKTVLVGFPWIVRLKTHSGRKCKFRNKIILCVKYIFR